MNLHGMFGLAGLLGLAIGGAAAAATQTEVMTPTEAIETREIAFVANAQDGTVSLVDVAARAVLGAIDINPAGTRAAYRGTPNYAQDTDVSPDGRVLYVSRGYLGDVAAFDIASGALLWRRPLETGRADHMALTREGEFLFVSAFADNFVDRIDTATGERTGRIASGEYPHDNHVSRYRRRVFNASIGPTVLPLDRGGPANDPAVEDHQITIADVDTLEVLDRIRFDTGIRPFRLTPDERGFYAQQSNFHGVIAYDFATRRVVRRLELPIAAGVTEADWDFQAPHHGLAMTGDGETLCLAGRASDYAALVRAPALELIATIPVGDAPGWAEIAGDGDLCVLANTRSDNLSIVSLRTRAEVARLPVGDGPKHITVTRIPESVVAAFIKRVAAGATPPR